MMCRWSVTKDRTIGSDVPESFSSSQSHKPFESESSENLSSQVRVESLLGQVESESSHKNGRVTSSHWFTSSSPRRVIQNFKLFLCIFGYRSAFLNHFLPQHPFWSRLRSPAPLTFG